MFAHNNEEIDYFRMAAINALLIQKNMGLHKNAITVITDSNTLEHAEKTLTKKFIKKAIGNIIINEKDIAFKQSNLRAYKDTSHRSTTLPFYNKNRADAYDLSPYAETILIDADYLILSDALNSCWNHNNDIMMNHDYHDIMISREFSSLDRLNPLGISMYWATVVYFKKTPYAQTLFDIVKHVRQHRTYYSNLYQWTGNIYRNDYSFSIAAHMVGGFTDTEIPQLPTKTYKTFDTDDIHSVSDTGDIVFYLEKLRSPGDFILTRWKGVDVHIMNKWAINRAGEKFLEILND